MWLSIGVHPAICKRMKRAVAVFQDSHELTSCYESVVCAWKNDMPAHRTVIYKTFTQGKFLTWSWPVFSTSCPTSMSSKILSTFLRQVRAEIVHSCVGVLLHDLFQFGASSRFFEQSPNSNFITSCDPCLNCVDAPSIQICPTTVQ